METMRELETRRLEAANRHIVATEERIEIQRMRVARLRNNGMRHDEPEKLLTLLLDALSVMRRYRQQVIGHLVELRTRHRQHAARERDAGE